MGFMHRIRGSFTNFTFLLALQKYRTIGIHPQLLKIHTEGSSCELNSFRKYENVPKHIHILSYVKYSNQSSANFSVCIGFG
jgi:hypothetical protein